MDDRIPHRGAAVRGAALPHVAAAGAAFAACGGSAVRGAAVLLVLVALSAVAAPPAAGQTLADYDYENLALTSVGLDYGYIWPNRVEPTSAYSLSADLGFLGPGVRLVPSATYWTSRLKTGELERLAQRFNRLDALEERGVQIDADDLGTIDWTDVAVALDAHVVWETMIGLFTYVGAGAALHVLDGSGTAIDETFVEDLLDTVTVGAAAMAGLEYSPAARVRIYAEGRYAVLSDLHYPMARLGASIVLPGRELR